MRGGTVNREILPFEEYRYVIYAKEFGWTPKQVDELPLSVEPWILPIYNAILEYESWKAEQDMKAAQVNKNLRLGGG